MSDTTLLFSFVMWCRPKLQLSQGSLDGGGRASPEGADSDHHIIIFYQNDQ